MHFALRVGGMAACSAGGSTATFKNYVKIEALQNRFKAPTAAGANHSPAWVSTWPQFYVTLGGYGRLIGRRQHSNP